MAPRPTFEHNGQPVRAAGVLLCTRVNGDRWYLLRKAKGAWQDMGGKTEPSDTSPVDTAIREAVEETNGHLFSPTDSFDECRSHLEDIIQRGKGCSIRYNKRCKYLLFICHVPHIKHLPMGRFGKYESTDGMEHYYKWFRCLPRLHFRLRSLRIHRDV